MTYQNVPPKQLKEWLDNQQVVLVDVREQYEYDAKHIPGAKLIPIGGLREHEFPPTDDKKLVVHCQLGKRGSMACEMLMQKYPHREVYNLEGGIIAWESAGYEVSGN